MVDRLSTIYFYCIGISIVLVCFKWASGRSEWRFNGGSVTGWTENRADGEVAALCENKQRALSPGEAMSKLI